MREAQCLYLYATGGPWFGHFHSRCLNDAEQNGLCHLHYKELYG